MRKALTMQVVAGSPRDYRTHTDPSIVCGTRHRELEAQCDGTLYRVQPFGNSTDRDRSYEVFVRGTGYRFLLARHAHVCAALDAVLEKQFPELAAGATVYTSETRKACRRAAEARAEAQAGTAAAAKVSGTVPQLLNVYGRTAHSHHVKQLLGLRATEALPAEGMPTRWIQGIAVYVLSLAEARNAGLFQRVRAICPLCGEHVSAGRLHQHVCK